MALPQRGDHDQHRGHAAPLHPGDTRLQAPVGEYYSAVESPKGELGWYIVSNGENHAYRARNRAPSFVNLQSLPVMSEGGMIADVIANIGSIDIVLGEVDR